MHIFWWIALALSTWGTLFLASDWKRFKVFWTGGIWSIGLAMLGEGLIRSRIDYFVARSLVIPFLGTDVLNFIGPRFVEGVLFMQMLRPKRKLLQVSLWVTGIVLSEMTLSLTGKVNLSWSGIGLALAVHSLRFLSLLGIHDALNYGTMRRQLMQRRKKQAILELVLQASRTFWALGWPVFGLGSAFALKLTRGLDRLVSRRVH